MNPIHYHSLIASLVFLFAPGLASAQGSEPINRININSVSVFASFEGRSDWIPVPSNISTLGTGSIMLPNDLSAFQDRYTYLVHNQHMYSILLGINFANSDRSAYRRTPTLRAGITYGAGPNLMGGFNHAERYPHDTLVSPTTGQVFYLDSLASRNYNLFYNSEQLRLDLSLVFQTPSHERLSMYAGIGFMAGISLNAITRISYHESNAVEGYVHGGTSRVMYSFPDDNFQSEIVASRTNSSIALYAPLGLEYRLGDQNDFWRMVNFFYEARPMYTITSIPELGRYNQTGIQHGIGVRVKWD